MPDAATCSSSSRPIRARGPTSRPGPSSRATSCSRPPRRTAPSGTSSARSEGAPVSATETNVDPALQLADLLSRVEALEKAEEKRIEKKNKLTIIAWGGDLDRIWPTTILASTAAASGMDTMVFFTFWGLFAIVKPGTRITGDNWMQKMMSAMNPGSAEKAKLSRYHFAGAGPAMFKKLADDHKVAKPDELIPLAQDLGVRLVPCQMTMDLLGLKREDLLDGLEEPIGAATAIREMREAAIPLFI